MQWDHLMLNWFFYSTEQSAFQFRTRQYMQWSYHDQNTPFSVGNVRQAQSIALLWNSNINVGHFYIQISKMNVSFLAIN